MPAAIGRPSTYSPEIAAKICERITSGESVRTICRDDEMPAISTVFKWLSERKEFSEQYARAREMQAEAMAEEILEIADDTSNDTEEIEVAEGVTIKRQNTEWINRSRLRVDTRKWLMSKMMPKKYGEKLQQEVTGELGIKVIAIAPGVELPKDRPALKPAFDEKLIEGE